MAEKRPSKPKGPSKAQKARDAALQKKIDAAQREAQPKAAPVLRTPLELTVERRSFQDESERADRVPTEAAIRWSIEKFGPISASQIRDIAGKALNRRRPHRSVADWEALIGEEIAWMIQQGMLELGPWREPSPESRGGGGLITINKTGRPEAEEEGHDQDQERRERAAEGE